MLLMMSELDDLRATGRMTWMEAERGWIAAPEEIVKAFARDGFDECKREVTTSRRDSRPTGGVWQGLNTHTGSVASAIWVTRGAWPQAVVFMTVDGEPVSNAADLRRPPPSPGQTRRDGTHG
jgi:hypothetical protein